MISCISSIKSSTICAVSSTECDMPETMDLVTALKEAMNHVKYNPDEYAYIYPDSNDDLDKFLSENDGLAVGDEIVSQCTTVSFRHPRFHSSVDVLCDENDCGIFAEDLKSFCRGYGFDLDGELFRLAIMSALEPAYSTNGCGEILVDLFLGENPELSDRDVEKFNGKAAETGRSSLIIDRGRRVLHGEVWFDRYEDIHDRLRQKIARTETLRLLLELVYKAA